MTSTVTFIRYKNHSPAAKMKKRGLETKVSPFSSLAE